MNLDAIDRRFPCAPLLCRGIDELDEVVDLSGHQLKGAALAETAEADRWIDALANLGATRVCEPGRLQAPPVDWMHDAECNILRWIDVTSVG